LLLGKTPIFEVAICEQCSVGHEDKLHAPDGTLHMMDTEDLQSLRTGISYLCFFDGGSNMVRKMLDTKHSLQKDLPVQQREKRS